MKRVPFIVLSGEAGSGKDSVAKILERDHGWTPYSLAGPLKRFVEDMFFFTKEQLYGPSHFRNEHNSMWDLTCPDCGGMGATPNGEDEEPGWCGCLRCSQTGKIEISVRSTCQPLGSEYLRDMIHPDVLTMRARPDIEKLLSDITQQGHGGVVVTDARYDNDRNNLHEWLGATRVDIRSSVVKVDGAAWRQHQSETDRPSDVDIDYVLVNNEEHPFPSLPKTISEMLVNLQII